MATAMQDVFGENLLTHPIEKNESCLPSPQHLVHKILLKHKKLPEGADDGSILLRREDGKQAYLYLIFCVYYFKLRRKH